MRWVGHVAHMADENSYKVLGWKNCREENIQNI